MIGPVCRNNPTMTAHGYCRREVRMCRTNPAPEPNISVDMCQPSTGRTQGTRCEQLPVSGDGREQKTGSPRSFVAANLP